MKLSRAQLTAVIVGLQLTLLVAALDQTIVVAAMPQMVASLGGFDRYAWVTTAYLLASTIAVPIFGKLSDLYGRKWLLLAGVVVFVLASVLCGFAGRLPLPVADGMDQLIAARTLKGLGGGMIMALVFASVGDLFSPAERGKYQGWFAAVFALSGLAGPALGGWISDAFSWRWVFLINVPVGVIAIAALLFAFPNLKKPGASPRVDWQGIFCLTGAVVPFLLALNASAGALPQVMAAPLSVIALVMFAGLVKAESAAPEPLIPPRVISNPIVAVSLASVFITGIGMFGSTLLIPIFLQAVMGYSATIAGSLLTPLLVTVAVSSGICGMILSRTRRYKRLAISGVMLMCAGTFLLSAVQASNNIYAVLGSMVVVGAGLGVTLPLYTIVIQNALPYNVLGTVTGLTQFFRTLGGAIGTAVFGLTILQLYNFRLAALLPGNLPPEIFHAVADPLDPVKLEARIRTVLGNQPGAAVSLEKLVGSAHEALVYAIGTVFFIYAFLLLAIGVLNFFLQEIPLKRSASDEEPPT